MSDIVFEWFSGLATLSGLLYFLAGFASAYITHCVRAKMRHREVTIPWHIAGIAVGLAAIVVITVQTQVAYNTAKETAQEVQDCQKEFNQALRDRARITTENDELSQIQRRIVFDWIHDLIFPPEPYAAMTTDDKRRQAYGLALTIRTEHQFKESLKRQDELQLQRQRSPLPDPTCGKS